MRNKLLNILCLIDQKDSKLFDDLIQDWKKYFEVNIVIDNPEKVLDYSSKGFDLLFGREDHHISNEQYSLYKASNINFSFILLAELPSEKDVSRFKNLVDRILYTGISYDYTVWSSIASLRRFWEKFSKPSTIIYRNIIADFVEQKFMIDKKEVFLTSKEIQLLNYFMNNREKIITKDEIFKHVWGYNTSDSTRTFDQMFFKLKSKIGRDYFEVKRNKGIIFK